MPRPRFRAVRIDEVKITRKGEYAHFDYADPKMGGLSAKVGPGIRKMTNADLLRWHNEFVRSRQALRQTYKHVAIEIVGRPQIEYSEECRQWIARGDVLRCAIATASGDAREPVIEIDDTELSLREFGELLSTREGWGMRVVFVPDDELHKTPVIKAAAGKKGR